MRVEIEPEKNMADWLIIESTSPEESRLLRNFYADKRPIYIARCGLNSLTRQQEMLIRHQAECKTAREDVETVEAPLYNVCCPECGNIMPREFDTNIIDHVLRCCGHTYKQPTIQLEIVE